MERTLNVVGTLFRYLTGAAFLVLIGSVLIQVVSRMLLPHSPVWTEELSRFALLFLVAFGCGLGWRTQELVNVDILLTRLSPHARIVLEVLTTAIAVAFCLYLIPSAWKFVRIGMMQTSPALGWPMHWIHFTALLAPLSLAILGIAHIVELVARFRKG
jgi:TRAP-type transport system small permease protein